jgi:beta-mannosidase
LVRPKEMKLAKQEILKEINPTDGGFLLKLKCPTLCKNVFLSSYTEGVFENNYFDILPNEEKVIFYKTKASADDIIRSFEIKSLVDTY